MKVDGRSLSSHDDGTVHATDVMNVGKRALVCLSLVLVLVCCLPNVTFLRPAGVMEGTQVDTIMSEIDIFVSSTGNSNIITLPVSSETPDTLTTTRQLRIVST